jgi:hypothetical protein
MLISFQHPVAGFAAVLAATVLAAAPSSGAADRVRVSALVDGADGVRVGIVDDATGGSWMLKPGARRGDVTVLAADFAREEATLRIAGEERVYRLVCDTNGWLAAQGPESPGYRGAAIEAFVRDHPGAVEHGRIKFPRVDEPARGRGEGIEAALAADPALRQAAGVPAEGLGSGIEEALRRQADEPREEEP